MSDITRPCRRPRLQRGITLVQLLAWSFAIAIGSLVTMRVVPTVNEYYTIQNVVDKVAKTGGNTVAEIRAAFDKTKEVEYSISSIGGQDLSITKENDRIVVSFAYDKEIPLFGAVSLLIRYKGRSH
ncbi:MAG: hypothetical protein RJA44_2464 [Pseudomonadota bacterium]|jgi:hypothetical protein